ncbi:MAG: hypothetical protein J0H34_02365 [Rhizobiales bacterium]|nr:hypothetical protein [Hyphomicrobiales bacterium]
MSDQPPEPPQPPPPPPGEQPAPQQQPVQPTYATVTVPLNPEGRSKATTSMILGICGLTVCPLVCSILALVFAKQAKNLLAMTPGADGSLFLDYGPYGLWRWTAAAIFV